MGAFAFVCGWLGVDVSTLHQQRQCPVRSVTDRLEPCLDWRIMHVRSIHLTAFRRFTDLTVDLGGSRPQLVMVCGPNGVGKSSLFDALWGSLARHHYGFGGDLDYYLKNGTTTLTPDRVAPDQIEVVFQGEMAPNAPLPRNAVYVRTAYRNEPEFMSSALGRAASPLDGPRPQRMIENDARVADNYQRLISTTIDSLFDGTDDERTGREIRDRLVGEIRAAYQGVFPHLELTGLGAPLGGGTFRFKKGSSPDFVYKNLSGGEKAVFDLLLDLVAKRQTYDDTVYCIDEPEAHINPSVHAATLDAMLTLIHPGCQLWLATHSAGMMRRARDIQAQHPEGIVFLDFDLDFDQPQSVTPIQVDTAFWRRTLSVSFGDLAELVAPERVILCEGEPGGSVRKDFDAQCLRAIFSGSNPDTEFLGVGNDSEVQTDSRGIGKAVEALAPGTKVERLIDRDDRSRNEVEELATAGVRVLSRRHLEAYLLDEEVLEQLCGSLGAPGAWPELQRARQEAIADSISRGNPADDLKSCAGQIFNAARRLLSLTGAGNDKDSFMRDTLAPLVRPGMSVYAELEADVLR